METSDYDIKNSIVKQKARGLLEPLKLNAVLPTWIILI